MRVNMSDETALNIESQQWVNTFSCMVRWTENMAVRLVEIITIFMYDII